MASGVITKGDDIDFDIVVSDDNKYTTYLMALWLGMRYSIRYRKMAQVRYFRILPKLICINVVWEESQVLPFSRRDEQVAYEIMNTEVVFGQEFFDTLISNNPWITEFFPQVREKGPLVIRIDKERKVGKKVARWREKLSRLMIIFMFRAVRLSRFFDRKRRARMDRVEKAKYPYGLFDVPRRRIN